jgi:tRNA pseudouridine38-40 synthase
MPDKVKRNICLTIEYDGTNYCGWQAQNHRKAASTSSPSIQTTIESSLRKILQEKVKLIASGRTDAGVHALAQVANFHTRSKMPLERMQLSLNSMLPRDISITKVEQVLDDFHSRFSAKTKLYRYTILARPHHSAFLKNQVYFMPFPIDVRLMQKEARALLGRHNFKAFQATQKKERNPIKTIKRIKINKTADLLTIDIEADGFLYNMVRNIVGTLVEIGRGRRALGSLKKILLSKDRKLAGPTAPAQGLALIRVSY